MKVALVGPVYPFRGGIAHYTSMLARALMAQNHEVLVVSYRRQYPRWLYPGQSDRDLSALASAWQVDAECLLDTLWPPTWWQSVTRLRRFGPELVILQWWTTFMGPLTWVLARALRHAGLRVAFVIHNVLPHEPRPGDAWLTKHVLGPGQAFVVHTQAELARLRGLLPPANAQVVAHPTYVGFVDQATDRDEARRQLGLPADAGVILFFGFVRPYKGLHILLEALARLHQSGKPAHLVVAGEFWGDQGAYEREIAKLGLESCVHLTRCYIPNEAVGVYFSAADVFAAPYTGGTQSGVVTIARSFGMPIVTTRPEDVVGQPVGPLGVQVVAGGDVEALAGALGATLTAQRAAANGWRQRPTPHAQAGLAEWEYLARVIAEMAADA